MQWTEPAGFGSAGVPPAILCQLKHERAVGKMLAPQRHVYHVGIYDTIGRGGCFFETKAEILQEWGG
jgi:hypothetical protein